MRRKYQTQLIRLVSIAALLAAFAFPQSAYADTPYLGMQPQELPQKAMAALGLEGEQGVTIRDVGCDTPAAEAGVMRGDIVIKMNGAEVSTLASLLESLTDVHAGDKIKLVVQRQNEYLDLELQSTEWPKARQIAKTFVSQLPDLGLTLVGLSTKIRDKFKIRWDSEGVLVTLVDPEKGISEIVKRGDVIVQFNQQQVWMPDQVLKAYKKAKDDGLKHAILLVERADGYIFIQLPVRQQ